MSTIPVGYKQTEVGVIPEDWEALRVCEFSSVVTGGTPKTEIREFWNGDYPWITPTDINERRDMWTSERTISELGLSSIRQLPANCVLVTCIASIGKNAILRSIGGCNQQINAVVPNDGHSAEFFYYSFESSKQYLLANAGMTATSIISKAAFEQLKFPVPPFPDQIAIAAALSDIDALLAKLDQLIAKKRDIKQAAMQQLLTGQKRLPGFSGEWEVVKAGDIGRFRGGSGFPIKFQGATSGEYPLFKVSDMNNVGNETFMGIANNYISESLRKQLGATVFPADSIVFAKVGAAVFLERKKILSRASCLDNNMAGFIMESSRAFCRFIHYVLLGMKLGSLVSTTALPSLSGSVLASIELHLPSIPEQTAIANVLSDMDAELDALQARRDKTRALKQGMMQELLTGRIRLV